MDSDSYTPAIPLDSLVELAKSYGPVGLSDENAFSGDGSHARRMIERLVCPCIRGEACICDAMADEFLRLAGLFRRQSMATKPAAYSPFIDRWENEGGRIAAGAQKSPARLKAIRGATSGDIIPG